MSEVSNLFVILMGMGTVFFGLICIVFLCMAMSAVIRSFQKNEAPAPQNNSQAPSAVPSPAAPIADRQAIIAASCACIAEELGTSVKNIKVVSFKRI